MAVAGRKAEKEIEKERGFGWREEEGQEGAGREMEMVRDLITSREFVLGFEGD